MKNNNDTPSFLMKILCFFTLTDPDVLKECGRYDKYIILTSFFRQILAASFIFVIVAYAVIQLDSDINPYIAGTFVALTIYFLDQSILSAEWSLRNPFKQGLWPTIKTFFFISPRIIISIVLAFAIASIAEIGIQSEAIKRHLQKETLGLNESFLEKLSNKESALSETETKKRNNIDTLINKRNEIISDINKYHNDIANIEVEIGKQKSEMHRQETGIGDRVPGKARYYNDALILKNNLESKKENLGKLILQYEKDVKEYNTQIQTAREDLSSYSDQINASLSEYRNELIANGEFYEDKGDLLVYRNTLVKIHNDSEIGEAAKSFSFLIKMLFIVIELMPVFVKLVFSPFSNYTMLKKVKMEKTRSRHKIDEGILDSERKEAFLRKSKSYLERISELESEIADIKINMTNTRVVKEAVNEAKKKAAKGVGINI